MANFQDKMTKKKGTGGVVAQMVQGNAEPEKVTEETPKVVVEETTTTTPPVDAEPEVKAEEPKKQSKKPEKVTEGVIAYKQVPDENKTVRKNIVLYPSLCKEIERIVNLEKKKGNKRFTFNDLVNQVLIEYANEYNKK